MRRERTIDALLIGAAALLLRVPALLAPTQLGFDDGQFAMSVIAMRGGALPYREVFSSQGPLFLPLAWLGDLLTFRTLDSPRTIAFVAGGVLAAVTYLAGRELTTRAGAWLAAALVAISGSVLWTTGPLTSDGPAEALATGAVALALWYRRSPSRAKAIWLGVLLGAAFSIKSLLVGPALVAAGLLVLDRRRWRDVVAVPAVALAVVLAAMLPWGFERVVDQSFRYHTDHAGQRELGPNLEKTVRTIRERDLPLVAAGVVAVVAALVAALRRGREPRAGRSWTDRITGGAAPIVVWAVLALVVLLLEAPMWRNHLAHVVPPVALLIGVVCARPRVAAVAGFAALLVVPWQATQLSDLLWPGGYREPRATIVEAIAALPPGARAVSDDPGLVWRAGKQVPVRFVDVSILRITSPSPSLAITRADVLRAAARPDVCAVVRTSKVRFGSFPNLGPLLRERGYRQVLPSPRGHFALWIKQDCHPSAQGDISRGGGRGDRASAVAGPRR